jgi:hypothetical protein
MDTLRFESEKNCENLRVLMKVDGYYIDQRIIASPVLARMLGFNLAAGNALHGDVYSGSGWITKYRGQREANLNDASSELLYVYTNVVRNRHVGQNMTPLLRIVDAYGARIRTVRRSFDRPQYIPVGVRLIDHIEIHITNDQGRTVTFKEGKCVVTLHFRQRSQV